jgi:hypothetical protein
MAAAGDRELRAAPAGRRENKGCRVATVAMAASEELVVVEEMAVREVVKPMGGRVEKEGQEVLEPLPAGEEVREVMEGTASTAGEVMVEMEGMEEMRREPERRAAEEIPEIRGRVRKVRELRVRRDRRVRLCIEKRVIGQPSTSLIFTLPRVRSYRAKGSKSRVS